MKFVIVGNGVAANSAAEAIRKIDNEGTIHMFSREEFPFYYTPALPEYLAGEKEIRNFTIHDFPWYEKNKIHLHLAKEIVTVDASSKKVITDAGDSYSYDRLLLATGGYSRIPPITGTDLDGVFTLRTIHDADIIRARARHSRNLVIIGCGLLGLEAGNGLRKAGLKVTFVESLPRLLPRQMDGTGGTILQKQLEEMGFTFFLGIGTREIIPDKNGLYVCLENDDTLLTDMIIISAGVCPEIGLGKSLGLGIHRGIKVDDSMKTEINDIFAAGDCIEHRGRYYGIWPAAMIQGKVAGANMAGEVTAYEGTVRANSLKVAGVELFAAGDIDAEGTRECAVYKNDAAYIYRKLVIQETAIIGAILLGDIRGAREIENAIGTGTDIGLLAADLIDPYSKFYTARVTDSII